MAWLGQPRPGAAARAVARHAALHKDRIEEELFARRRDLLTTLDMVFFDTTSIYFEGQGGAAMGQHGFSKDTAPISKHCRRHGSGRHRHAHLFADSAGQLDRREVAAAGAGCAFGASSRSSAFAW